MNNFWNTNIGKLFIGSCGTQVGMLLSCASLAIITSFCMVCVVSSTVSSTIAYEIAKLSPGESLNVSSVDSSNPLNKEIEAMLRELNNLRVDVDSPQNLSEPNAFARMNGVNLRSGPGIHYNKVGFLPRGQHLTVVGRNSDSSWWLVSTPNGYAWLSGQVTAINTANQDVPIVTVPALLVHPSSASASLSSNNIVAATPAPSPTPAIPVGTPTAAANARRLFVQDTAGYKELSRHLASPPISQSFSPHGNEIAIIEGIKLYTVASDASYSQVWLEDTEVLRPIGGAVWSPDGKYIAFIVDYKQKRCQPCRSVAIISVSEKSLVFVKTPNKQDSDAPRWTQDGRLLVNVYPLEKADGTTYIYNTSGEGQVALGSYLLSSGHEGQKWYPWIPGHIWQAQVAERPDNYNKE